jgi:hypothetical protein
MNTYLKDRLFQSDSPHISAAKLSDDILFIFANLYSCPPQYIPFLARSSNGMLSSLLEPAVDVEVRYNPYNGFRGQTASSVV